MMNPNLQRLIELLGESMKPSHGYTIAETAPEVVTAPGVYFPAEKGEVIPMQSRQSGGAVVPPNDELLFQKWYADWSKKLGLNPNPDDPLHYYDYRGAYKAGATPNETGHWPSQFKREGHPNLFINGVDTRTGTPMQSREKGGEVNPSNPSGDNEKERLGMLKDILFKVNPNQPKLESQQPKLESRQGGGPVSPEGEPYVDPIQKSQLDILKTIAQALKTPAPPEGWGPMKTGMGLNQRTSGYGSPPGPSMFSNQGSPGLPTPDSYSMKPMALKDSDMDRISRAKGLASTGEELWQRKRTENQIPLIPAQGGANVVPPQEDEYEKLRQLLFAGGTQVQRTGPMGEPVTLTRPNIGPERFFTGSKEVPPTTRGAVSGEELVRQKFGQEGQEREAILNKMAQPGSYYEAHPEERMMDIEWERTKPLRDIITKAIEDERTRQQGYGEGFGPTPNELRLGRSRGTESPSQMPLLLEELRRTSGGEVPGRGTTNMGLGTPHLVQNESGQYQWTYPPSTTQPKGAVLPAGVTAKATPKNQQPYITPEGKTILVDTSSPDAQRIINEGKLKPAPLAAAETRANIWSIVPNATSGAYFDKARKKWFVDTTEGEKELTSDEIKTLNLQIKEQAPTETTKTMQQTAPKVLALASRVKADLAKEVGSLGPAVSRWRDFWAGTVGAPDPAFTKLMTDVGLLSTLLMRMHVGARGGVQIMEHFKGMMDAGKLSPENLSAAIDTIVDYANDVNKPMVGGSPSSPVQSPSSSSVEDLRKKYNY